MSVKKKVTRPDGCRFMEWHSTNHMSFLKLDESNFRFPLLSSIRRPACVGQTQDKSIPVTAELIHRPSITGAEAERRRDAGAQSERDIHRVLGSKTRIGRVFSGGDLSSALQHELHAAAARYHHA